MGNKKSESNLDQVRELIFGEQIRLSYTLTQSKSNRINMIRILKGMS